MNAQSEAIDRIVRVAEVARRTGLSRATLYRRIAAGQFPASVSLGGKSVGWRESELTKWIDERSQAVQS